MRLYGRGKFVHALFLATFLTKCLGGQVPRYDHVVVVIEENKNYAQIIGSASAPYINSLATAGALFTNSLAIEYPSQLNYLDLYSGSNQGVTTDNMPAGSSKPSTWCFALCQRLDVRRLSGIHAFH